MRLMNDMDIRDLQTHVDKRFDHLESKLDTLLPEVFAHKQRLVYLEGFSKIIITILISIAGFLALAYFPH